MQRITKARITRITNHLDIIGITLTFITLLIIGLLCGLLSEANTNHHASHKDSQNIQINKPNDPHNFDGAIALPKPLKINNSCK